MHECMRKRDKHPVMTSQVVLCACVSQDKGVWLSVIEMLRKRDKLPVVAFVFSKRRIEETAAYSSSAAKTKTKHMTK